MTAPVFMCQTCAKLAVADRPVDPNPPHDPLSTDAVALRNEKPVCAYHRDKQDSVITTGFTRGGVFRR